MRASIRAVWHGLGGHDGEPASLLDRLAVAVGLMAARAVLRDVITLADQAPGLTDAQLRHRLAALAGLVARVSR
ncbi:MAG TPA: hypothetical protein VFO16_19150 [Pseudonocardiaceae bacterium]|nr:hypothetical protein [Pseudonocardiaceae bacterium]